MELKGIITTGEQINLTCCESITDILIGGESLFDALTNLFKLDSEEFYNDSQKQSPKYSVRYIILDEAPKEYKSFDQHSSEVVVNMICGEHINGCYSEWTCGYGSFDYVNGDGHSIFKELEDKQFKYIHFKI